MKEKEIIKQQELVTELYSKIEELSKELKSIVLLNDELKSSLRLNLKEKEEIENQLIYYKDIKESWENEKKKIEDQLNQMKNYIHNLEEEV